MQSSLTCSLTWCTPYTVHLGSVAWQTGLLTLLLETLHLLCPGSGGWCLLGQALLLQLALGLPGRCLPSTLPQGRLHSTVLKS